MSYERPDVQPFGEGLKVRLARVDGLTEEDVLPYPFYFQVPPLEEFSIEGTAAWSDYDTLRLGQRSRPGGEQLRTVTFGSLFVDWDAPWMVWHPGEGGWDAGELTKELFDIMDACTPFELFVHYVDLRDRPEFHHLASLRSVRSVERAGEPDAKYVDVQFVEYERMRLRRNSRDRTPEKDRKHTLRSTDTLRGIALRYYGEGMAWRRIASANGIRGVSSESATELASWARKHSRKTLKIPARESSQLVTSVTGGGAALGG